MIDTLIDVFNELQQILTTNEMGYHEIRDGKLRPVYKTDTELTMEKWKNIHSKNPVYVKDDPLLQEIVNNKKVVAVSNVEMDERSSQKFKLFNIYSVMIIPIVKDEEVIGIVDIPFINRYRDFTDEEIVKCKEVVNRQKRLIINHTRGYD